jgi:hypothetical protein
VVRAIAEVLHTFAELHVLEFEYTRVHGVCNGGGGECRWGAMDREFTRRRTPCRARKCR